MNAIATVTHGSLAVKEAGPGPDGLGFKRERMPLRYP